MVQRKRRGGGDSVVGATSRVQSDADRRLPYPLFAVACQLVLQVLGLQLELGPLLDLLLALGRELLPLLSHGRDLRLELTHNSLCLLQKGKQNKDTRRVEPRSNFSLMK